MIVSSRLGLHRAVDRARGGARIPAQALLVLALVSAGCLSGPEDDQPEYIGPFEGRWVGLVSDESGGRHLFHAELRHRYESLWSPGRVTIAVASRDTSFTITTESEWDGNYHDFSLVFDGFGHRYYRLRLRPGETVCAVAPYQESGTLTMVKLPTAMNSLIVVRGAQAGATQP